MLIVVRTLPTVGENTIAQPDHPHLTKPYMQGHKHQVLRIHRSTKSQIGQAR